MPWFITTASVLTLALIAYFLLHNIEWYKSTVFDMSVTERNTAQYRIYAYQMHLSMIKRSIGLFSGMALMFLGMSVVFYSVKDKFSGEFKGPVISAQIATASPGIIALIIGAYLIIATIQSKDEFPGYSGDNKKELVAPPKP